MVHGGGMARLSCWWSVGPRAWQRCCRAAARAGSRVAPTGGGCPRTSRQSARVLQDGEEPTVVVAHSYGGIVTAEAAAGVSSVHHLMLVSSYLPEVGQSLSDFGDGTPAPFLDVDPDSGTFGVRPEFLVETFLQDCDPDTQAQAADKLARQSVHVTAQPVGAAAWQQVPSTYLVCAQDKGTPARLQRDLARKAGTVVELDTGHHPFLSQPAAVQNLLLSL